MTTFSILHRPILRVLAAVAHFTWGTAHRLLAAMLALLEPVVRFVCVLAMLFGIFSAVVFEISAVGTTFPFLRMLAASLGFGLVLVAYYALLGLLSR